MNFTTDLSDLLPSPEKKSEKMEAKRQAKAKQVKAAFEAEGYTLISEYKAAHQKLNFICPRGHEHSISWSNFCQGCRCAHCSGRIVAPQKVKEAFEAEGYTLTSEYENSNRKLNFICPNGHEHSIAWGSFRRGDRCAHCAGQVVTHQQVKEAFDAEGYTLLSEYENANKKLSFICPNGHEHSMRWNCFQQGARCAHCAGLIVTHQQVKEAFEAEGYTLISEYESNNKKLNFICPNGHEHYIIWSAFRVGQRCAHCAGQVVTHQQVKEVFEAEGYELLSRYENNRKKLKFICPSGHEHSMVWDAFRTGCRCGVCFHTGYNLDRPGSLYYVRFDLPSGIQVYKIGITNLSVKKRFYGEPIPYKTIWQQRFSDGRIPLELERRVLRKYEAHRYTGRELKSGNTECFTSDVLGYDKLSAQLNLWVA